jgi:RNA polymerase sigma-70 factor (ECF subfamily)
VSLGLISLLQIRREGSHASTVIGETSAAEGSSRPDRRDLDHRSGNIDRVTLHEDVLVARARDGDARAFEQLVRCHQRAMYAVALRILGNPADAEDATQDGFVTAWRRLPQFRSDARFSTWLYRIVVNHALTELRRRARRADTSVDPSDLDATDQPVASNTDPYQHSEATALLADLRTALADLPTDLKVCWVLREVEDCSYEEVATIVGVTLDTARGRIYRARRRLAETMAPWR